MLTRLSVSHFTNPVAPQQVLRPAFARVKVVNGIAQTWAVTRPGSSPDTGSHLWNVSPPNVCQRGGFQPLTPKRPRVEMDPSDSTTWQRTYRFSS